ELGTSNNCAHGLAHGYIGGNHANPHISFRDPFVFLLHSNVDRLWAMWQTIAGHPERLDPNRVYGSKSSDRSITDPLAPWSGLLTWAGRPVWATRPWFMPDNQQSTKSCKDPSVVQPPKYDTIDPCISIVHTIDDLENQISVLVDDLASISGDVPPAERAKIAAALRAEIRRLGRQLAAEEKLLQD